MTEQDRILRSSLYALAILSLRTIGSYLTTQPNHCGFSVNCVPTGLARRAGLRDTLFHRMRHLNSTLNDKMTPGGASGIIVDKAFGELRRSILNVYNVYLLTFLFISYQTHLHIGNRDGYLHTTYITNHLKKLALSL